jgi:hypothetical protein
MTAVDRETASLRFDAPLSAGRRTGAGGHGRGQFARFPQAIGSAPDETPAVGCEKRRNMSTAHSAADKKHIRSKDDRLFSSANNFHYSYHQTPIPFFTASPLHARSARQLDLYVYAQGKFPRDAGFFLNKRINTIHLIFLVFSHEKLNSHA